MRHKDFPGFLKTYRKYYSTGGIRQMLYKDRKKLVYIVIILILLLLMLVANEEGDAKPRPDQKIEWNRQEHGGLP